jgi:hypothetical protein
MMWKIVPSKNSILAVGCAIGLVGTEAVSQQVPDTAQQAALALEDAWAQEDSDNYSGPDPAKSRRLSGLAAVSGNFDRQGEIERSQYPVHEATNEPIGSFRFVCQPGQLNWDDPIVYPGVRGGSPHLHQWVGNTRGNAFSTYRSLRTKGGSTCMGPLNRSAYWMPAMITADDQVVRPEYVSIYYKRYPASSPWCQQVATRCLPLPNGLRFVFGYDMKRIGEAQSENLTFQWKCITPQNTLLGNVAHRFDQLICPAGNTLMVTLAAPDCWDGINLDSPTHRSHIVPQKRGSQSGQYTCPAGYPNLVPTFTIGAAYKVVQGDDIARWHLSSDRMPGMPSIAPGGSFHADWFGAWDDETLRTWTSNCIDRKLNCSDGVLGDGTIMRRPANFSLTANPRLVAIPPRANQADPHNHH